MKVCIGVFLLLIAPLAAVPPTAAEDLSQLLGFEGAHRDGWPLGWGGGPPGTVGITDEVVHGGQWALRLSRDAESPGRFSSVGYRRAIDFAGTTIELRGYLRTENADQHVGLWLRQDDGETSVAFDNMRSQGLKGTTPWRQYSVVLPLSQQADRLVFGVLLSGQGTAWADDLEVLVDGKPLAEAPPRPTSVLDTDRQFDQGFETTSAAQGVALVQGPRRIVQIESLARLGQVWGFLKYHHPRVASGELHWDYELLRALPAVFRARDQGAALQAITEWAQGAGPPPPCDPCATLSGDRHLEPPIGWIHDRQLLGDELATYLETVHRRRFAAGQQFYVGQGPQAKQPLFANEPSYSQMTPPDLGFRLLALFRFWNIIEYWSPYRDVIGEDWHGVLRQLIPIFVEATTLEQYHRAVLVAAARVHDSHTDVWQAHGARPPVGDCQFPVHVRFLGRQPVIAGFTDGSASEAAATEAPARGGARLGDVVTAIDGRPVAQLLEAWAPFYPASNEPARLNAIARSMTRGACGAGALTVLRDRPSDGPETEVLTLLRRPIAELDLDRTWRRDRPGPAFQQLSAEVVYLKLSTAKNAEVGLYLARAANSRGWIIDLRNYPQDFVVFTLGGHLVDRKTEFTLITEADLANPGAFLWRPSKAIWPAQPHYDGQVVILVDETSLSRSEFTAMALSSAPGAIIVGSTTAGADGNASAFTLPGGLRTQISGIGVFYPDRRPTQRVGIVPDVPVQVSVEGIREGRDEVLEEALRQILGETLPEAEIRRIAALPPEPQSREVSASTQP